MEKYFLDFINDKSNGAVNAIFVNDSFYTYTELTNRVTAIAVKINEYGYTQKSIGVYLDDHIDTYASILAIWYTGNIYIPLHPTYPKSRIENIIGVSNIVLILATENNIKELDAGVSLIDCSALKPDFSIDTLIPYVYKENDIVYVLFTSGSTGVPKGVQISYDNLDSFLDNLEDLSLQFPKGSGYLQMFELTFDLSIVSILLPLMNAGTLYHVSSKSVKYLEIYRLLEEYSIQFAIIVPSVLAMLRPYFESIDLPDLLAVGLSGEAVPLELTEAWQKCCKNARFFNFYGPTECTIFCTYCEIPGNNIHSQNGIVSIGKPTKHCKMLCLNEDKTPAEPGQKSILWIGGRQVSPGYLNNEELNQKVFMMKDGLRFYNTGDIVIEKDNNELFYLGRQDHQVKINGYRIELSEVEFNSSKALDTKAVVIAVKNSNAISQLILFVTKLSLSDSLILTKLNEALPGYMVPSKIIQIDEFPLNDNGKLDRKQLHVIYDRYQ